MNLKFTIHDSNNIVDRAIHRRRDHYNSDNRDKPDRGTDVDARLHGLDNLNKSLFEWFSPLHFYPVLFHIPLNLQKTATKLKG